MKLLKYILLAISGLFVFSIFVTCVYAGGFVTGAQTAVGYFLTFFTGLGLLAAGIIGIYENVIRGKENGNRQKK